MLSGIDAPQSPRARLAYLFALWKTLLLAIAWLSPGPGYDTSTQLLFGSASTQQATATTDPFHGAASALNLVAQKLTRWDGIYFVSNAHRGYILEQEWAFSWAYTRIVKLFAQCMITCP